MLAASGYLYSLTPTLNDQSRSKSVFENGSGSVEVS